MSNITPGHIRAFQIVQTYENVTLTDCVINGEPGVAVVLVDRPNPRIVSIMPLFVAINAGMKIDFPGEIDTFEPRLEYIMLF